MALEAMAQLERHGGGGIAGRAFAGFVALPAPKRPHEVLGIPADADATAIRSAWRARIGAHTVRLTGLRHRHFTRKTTRHKLQPCVQNSALTPRHLVPPPDQEKTVTYPSGLIRHLSIRAAPGDLTPRTGVSVIPVWGVIRRDPNRDNRFAKPDTSWVLNNLSWIT